MTEKRYFSIDYDEEYYIFDSTKISKEEVLEKAEYSYDVFGDSLMENEIVDLLNENEQLKREKERYKRLSEIRDEDINNRILSLKEFINNCEDEKVKNILEDFFYSEVNEYDLAKENRELKNENEQLKKVAKEFVQNQTQHNFWKLRIVLKDSGVE